MLAHFDCSLSNVPPGPPKSMLVSVMSSATKLMDPTLNGEGIVEGSLLPFGYETLTFRSTSVPTIFFSRTAVRGKQWQAGVSILTAGGAVISSLMDLRTSLCSVTWSRAQPLCALVTSCLMAVRKPGVIINRGSNIHRYRSDRETQKAYQISPKKT